MKKIIGVIFLMVLAIVSCKEPVVIPNNGIYRGTFTKINSVLNDGDTNITLCTIALSEQKLSFSFTVDTSYGIPYACAGDFEILDDTRIKFKTNSWKEPLWNPAFYLDTIYNYTFNDNQFSFTKLVGDETHTFDLVRN